MCWNSKFLYLDTCIIIELSKRNKLLNRFIKFINQNEYKIVLSDILCLELIRRSNLNKKYFEVISQIPHILALPADKLTEAEILSYPDKLKRTIEYFEVYDPKEVIKQLILNRKINEANTIYEEHRKILLNKVNIFKTNQFEAPWQAAYLWAANSFKHLHPIRWRELQENPNSLEIERLPSIWLQAHVAYDKYVNYGVNAIESDLGDFHHLTYMPYCSFVITEEKMKNSLNKIKSETKSTILNDIEFKDMKFVREL